ncbi:MAG TPA: hypothetical protein VHK22_02190 [Gaiellaceae bacterium]|nr:hypothetical protein [Gaiellaceae bacterium]
MATEPRTDIAGVLDIVENADRFLIQQVFKPIANEYRISVPPPGSTEEGPPLLFVKQKRLSIREDIRFRLDPDADEHLFMIRARTVFEFRGRHDVLDAEGAQIGVLEKDFARSLVRSHWHVRDPAGAELFEAYEASWPIAIVRRVAGFLPEFLAVFEWLPFNFMLMREGAQVGSYKRVLGKLRDRYVLELGPELDGVDRRLVLAFAVGLDALQDR